jgi:hypothetical protein
MAHTVHVESICGLGGIISLVVKGFNSFSFNYKESFKILSGPQAIGCRPEGEAKGLTHPEIAHKILTDPNNRYVARQICYILTIEGLETYILVPSDPLDFDRLAQALRPAPDVGDIDVIIGRRGPMASPEMCNGLVVPIVIVDQIYSFDRDTLMKAIPKRKEKGTSDEQFRKTGTALFNHIIQIADNAGVIDEHRALNYLAVRYDEIYHRTLLIIAPQIIRYIDLYIDQLL